MACEILVVHYVVGVGSELLHNSDD